MSRGTRIPRRDLFGNRRGQMTVELMALLPILIVVAVIAVNALLFFSDCAAFDRLARQDIRARATSPAAGQSESSVAALIEQDLESQMSRDYLDCTVEPHVQTGGMVRYTARVRFRPTLFGMGFKDQVFGVSLPSLSHETGLTVDPCKPGELL